MRMLLIAALALCGLYMAAAGAMFAFQRQLQYFPSHHAPTPAEAGFEGATEVALTAADGTKILLWYAAAPPGAATILYFQGKGGEIADRPKRWASYRAAGLGVAYLSYRGYGASEGSPTEAGLHMDADAAYEWLIAQSVTPDRIAVVGESLGTGVAAQLAADLPIGALILEAPYTSVAEVAAARFPWLPVRWLILDPFRSIDVINRVTCPLLILHGDADTRVPPEMGKTLFASATGTADKELILRPGVGHVALFSPETWTLEIAFLARVLPGP